MLVCWVEDILLGDSTACTNAHTARTVLPLEGVVSVLACIKMAAGNPSNGRCTATYFYSSTSGLVGKWLYDHYLKLMNNCVR